MTRRELKDAVVEAARVQVAAQRTRGHHDVGRADVVLSRSVDALDACTEPDLDALNAAVAEAAEEYVFVTPAALDKEFQPARWVIAIDAINARRAAMLPKPRYEALGNAWTIFDNHEQKYLLPPKVADLLNKAEK
jgi:uncharacterized protein with von Willebrand factor type A (vWA) domain